MPQLVRTFPIHMKCSNILNERLDAMRLQEGLPINKSRYYLEDADKDIVDSEARYVMTTWAYQFVDAFQIQRECVSVAFSHLDRFLSKDNPIVQNVLGEVDEFQLCVMSALLLSIKMTSRRNAPTTQLLANLTRGRFSATDISRMEFDILSVLGWRLAKPTPQSFLEHFLVQISMQSQILAAHLKEMLEHARYQIELSVMDYRLITASPSTIALASLYNCIQSVVSTHGIAMQTTDIIHTIDLISTINVMSQEFQQIALSLEILQDKDAILTRQEFTSFEFHSIHANQTNMKQSRSSPICVRESGNSERI